MAVLALASRAATQVGASPLPQAGYPGVPPAQPTNLNVGIGGEYDPDVEVVNLTAGVENRPGVGIGDDTYVWFLDGQQIRDGKELMSIQVDTENLAAGDHEIRVTVTDTVNNATGSATFKFTKKAPVGSGDAAGGTTGGGAAGGQPGAGTGGQLQLTSPSGTQNMAPGASIQVPQGGGTTLQAKCEEMRSAIPLLMATWLGRYPVDGGGDEHRLFTTRASVIRILVNVYKVNCEKLTGPLLGRPAVLRLPAAVAHAAPNEAFEAGAEIELTVEAGPGRFQPAHDGLDLRVHTSTVTVYSQGKTDFGVVHDPDANETHVACFTGRVNLESANPDVGPLTLDAGEGLVATVDGLGEIVGVGAPVDAGAVGEGADAAPTTAPTETASAGESGVDGMPQDGGDEEADTGSPPSAGASWRERFGLEDGAVPRAWIVGLACVCAATVGLGVVAVVAVALLRRRRRGQSGGS